MHKHHKQHVVAISAFIGGGENAKLSSFCDFASMYKISPIIEPVRNVRVYDVR